MANIMSVNARLPLGLDAPAFMRKIPRIGVLHA